MSRKNKRIANRKAINYCDICKSQTPLVEHHINGRINNEPWNLAYICSNCHYEIHLGKIIIEQWVQTTGGRMLIWHRDGEQSITGNDAKPHIIPNVDKQESSIQE